MVWSSTAVTINQRCSIPVDAVSVHVRTGVRCPPSPQLYRKRIQKLGKTSCL